MKILKISGKNLASLASPFSVDFTTAPLANSGLFAICGPTGAGKSTLLDALCLALYDNTPRLMRAPTRGKMADAGSDTLTQSDSRNLLSRGASEGFAEVDFIGNDGHAYRARWSVSRARGRNGIDTLKPVNMSLHALDHLQANLQAIGNKPKEVLQEIERRIGLNFAQFTRAVLLAQNEFAAFLKADENERGELLQTLTGSNIYEQLSQRAFEKHKQEEAKLKQIKEKLQEQTPLTESARAALTEELTAASLALQNLEQRKSSTEHEQRMFQQLQKLREHHQQALQQVQTCLQKQADSQPQRAHLAAVLAVQPARPLLQEEDRNQLELSQAQSQIRLAEQGLQQAASAQQSAQQALQQANTALLMAETAQSDALPLLDQAKALDTRLQTLTPAHERAKQQRDSLAISAQLAAEARQAKLDQLEQHRNQLQQCQQWLQEQQHLQPLAQDWSRWETHFTQAANSANEFTQLEHTVQEQRAALQNQENLQAQASQQLAASQLALAAAQEQHSQASEPLKSFNYPALQADKQALETQREELAQTRTSWQRLIDLAQQDSQWQDRQRQVSLEQTQASVALQAALKAAPDLTSRLAEAEKIERLALAASSESVEDLRASLETDSACPVCGSTEHPYREESPQLRATLQALAGEVAQRRTLLAENLAEQARQSALQENRAAQLQQIKEELQTLAQALEQEKQSWLALQRCNQICRQLQEATANSANPQTLAAQWLAQQDETSNRQLQELRIQEKAWQAAQQQQQTAQHSLNLAQQEYSSAKENLNLTRISLEQIGNQLSLQQQRMQDASLRIAQSLQELQQAFANDEAMAGDGGWQESWRASPSQFQGQCHAQVKLWDIQQASSRDLSAALDKLAIELSALEQQRQKAEQEASAANTAYGQSELEMASMQAQRMSLFTGRSVQEVQASFAQAILLAKQQQQQQQQASQQSERELARCNEALSQANLRQAQLQAQLLQAQQQLQAWLKTWLNTWPPTSAPTAAAEELADEAADGVVEGAANEEQLQQAQQRLRELLAFDSNWRDEQQRQLQALAQALEVAQTVLQEREQACHEQEAALSQHLAQLGNALAANAALSNGGGNGSSAGSGTSAGAAPSQGTQDMLHISQLLENPSAAIAQLQILIEQLQAERQQAQQLASRLAVDLARDDERRQQAANILAQIAAQEGQYARWAKLNELIGSSDGKKFRNFAQQFTLDVLLGYANHHLRELGRRYRLERNKGSLALLVVDQDMGDELRSVHSLSGGESFLVSLALALGLASLSSNRVKVESLFIDEGFGSLDADTLRVAMDALDGLQAMGRKVGVISHVQEMTERIAAKISVQRVSGGRSVVRLSA